jgi:hypothetical protein
MDVIEFSLFHMFGISGNKNEGGQAYYIKLK